MNENDQRIILIARAKAKPQLIQQVKKTLLSMIEPTRAEQGCIEYNLHQSADDPSVFFFYEIWESKEALDSHTKTPHLMALVEKADDLFAEPLDVTSWKMIS